MTAKTQRRVHIIARYEMKGYKDIVCYRILSSNGIDEYRTCYAAGRVNCDCKGFQGYGHCYHGDEIKRREEERKNALLDHAYELLAEMRAAVAQVPSFVEGFRNGTRHSCDLCGKETKQAGICGACTGY